MFEHNQIILMIMETYSTDVEKTTVHCANQIGCGMQKDRKGRVSKRNICSKTCQISEIVRYVRAEKGMQFTHFFGIFSCNDFILYGNWWHKTFGILNDEKIILIPLE